MPLDADTNYYAMPTDAAGISPMLDPYASDPNAQQPDPASATPGIASLLALLAQATGKGKAAPLVPPTIANSPGLAALMRDPGITQSAAPAPSPDPTQALAQGTAAPADPDFEQLSSAPAPQSSPSTPQMPKMAKHNDTILQVLGTLSALAGGAGGNIAGQYIQNRNAGDLQNYNQQIQQQQLQQQTQNNQADASSQFVDRLAKYDPATQLSIVQNLTPAMKATYGYTDDAQIKSQFFNPDGSFKPVTADDSKTAPSMLRAQAFSRTTLYQMSPKDQQALHDQYAKNPDDWTQQTGLPYDGFTPGQLTKDITAADRVAETVKNDAATQLYHGSLAQNAKYKTFLSLSPALQSLQIANYASHPQDTQKDMGVPFESLKPGQTEANLLQSTAIANRENDAQRSSKDRLAIANMNDATRNAIAKENNAVAMRGQNLRQQLGDAAINQRARVFQMKYGTGSRDIEQQYQQITRLQMQLQKRNSDLSKLPTDTNGIIVGLSPRDQGRIDENGNIVKNPVPTAQYQEYMDNLNKINQLDQIKAGLTSLGTPPTAQFGGGGPMRPAPVTVGGNTRLPPGSPVRGPIAPPLPATSSLGHLVQSLPSPGRMTNVAPGQTLVSPPAQPQTQALSPTIVHGQFAGQNVIFHAPRSKAEFEALTPLKRMAYIAYLRKIGKMR